MGASASDLGAARAILEELQAGRCFYCAKPVPRQAGHVNHFIPWSKYSVHLGHNFVVAHQSCNSAKADHLAAAEFLAAWAQRNAEHRSYLAEQFSLHNVLHDLPTSARIANWAYEQTFEAGGLTWLKREEMVPLPMDWRRPIEQLL